MPLGLGERAASSRAAVALVERALCTALLDGRADIAFATPVAAEAAWMIESRLGSRGETTFVGSIAHGELALVEIRPRTCDAAPSSSSPTAISVSGS
jgi:hypothetical protein